jgi:hypothetical protein
LAQQHDLETKIQQAIDSDADPTPLQNQPKGAPAMAVAPIRASSKVQPHE